MRRAGSARLTAALEAAGIGLDQVTSRRELAGGTFNTVYLVRLIDGTRLVVKLPPDPAVPVLQYEQGILATEAEYYQLVSRCPGVMVPAVIAIDAGGGYLVMTYLSGSPWRNLAPPLAGRERDDLRADLGRQVAALHAVTGTGFGYPSGALGPLQATWRTAFLDMVDAVLDDATRFAVPLPRPAADIRDLFRGQASALDGVTTPVLVHFDLWDGNILVHPSLGGPRISGLIDAERAFWGDPLADFVSLALFGDIEQDTAFLHGYRSAGATVTFDASARRRLALYRAYLYLIMWTEAVPRQSTQARRDQLRELVLQPLVATLTEWSAQR
jgi:aminoglycoside phosphotransferase (APT) family kinase protein